ncbi:hypothetical protein ASPZODRAFT_129772 [Penicilliopsis zonata CBS 506.65]|uniref:PCI domain-containing protein n=1 Tax=Penicilliopsis zonata CBS 506.65 TaxID=1073090 RepID=A0A1L9SQH2_9EURO|nr:hypothetical protein ASPZODRAFT_129772 [Penicilliopsis zonata CBS 506.65]OJJ49334.1 hypothetical protein ASPZODRAFT_129772 [Penicilliopsis zonata CBS 506.65]
MDQVHSRALEALQPFVHLANANSATSPRFVANIITNATSSPHTYVFAELLETPTIQSLNSPDTPDEFRGYLRLLEIFAWGTWQEYQSTPNLPQLNQQQTLKLRLLSLLTLSATLKTLSYSSLMAALSITDRSELETLVTTAIYSSLITARLSPASTPPTVNVTAVAPLRDVNVHSLPTMISVLAHWETRCNDVIRDVEAEIKSITAKAQKRQADERARAQQLEKALASSSSEGGGGGGGVPLAQRKGGPHPAGNSNNKREFTADDDQDDDGYWDDGAEGVADQIILPSRMDIDEGAGAARAGPSSARHAKRVLGKKS